MVGTGTARRERMVILHRATTFAFDVCWRWLNSGGIDCAPKEGKRAVLETPIASVVASLMCGYGEEDVLGRKNWNDRAKVESCNKGQAMFRDPNFWRVSKAAEDKEPRRGGKGGEGRSDSTFEAKLAPKLCAALLASTVNQTFLPNHHLDTSFFINIKMSALATSSDKQFVIRRGTKDDCPAILDFVRSLHIQTISSRETLLISTSHS